MSKICKQCNSTDTAKWYSGPICRKCYKKLWYEKNRDKEKANMQSYYDKNADALKEYAKQYYSANKDSILQKTRQYKKDFYNKNKKKDQEYREKNKEAIRQRKQRYYQNNKKKIHEKRAQYLENNMGAKLAARVRTRVYLAIKNKGLSLPEYLGCTTEELISHLESRFQSGMSWDNYGEWHIDHIVPLSTFNLSDTEELKKACNYTNLQPLWANENWTKGNKYDTKY